MPKSIESGEIEWQDDATEETAPFPFSEIIYVVFGSMVLRLLAKNYYSSHHILVHSHVIAEHLEKGIVAGLMFKSTKKRVMLALSQLGLKQVVCPEGDDSATLHELCQEVVGRTQDHQTFFRLVKSVIRDAGNAIDQNFAFRVKEALQLASDHMQQVPPKQWPYELRASGVSEWLMNDITQKNDRRGMPRAPLTPEEAVNRRLLRTNLLNARASKIAPARGDETFCMPAGFLHQPTGFSSMSSDDDYDEDEDNNNNNGGGSTTNVLTPRASSPAWGTPLAEPAACKSREFSPASTRMPKSQETQGKLRPSNGRLIGGIVPRDPLVKASRSIILYAYRHYVISRYNGKSNHLDTYSQLVNAIASGSLTTEVVKYVHANLDLCIGKTHTPIYLDKKLLLAQILKDIKTNWERQDYYIETMFGVNNGIQGAPQHRALSDVFKKAISKAQINLNAKGGPKNLPIFESELFMDALAPFEKPVQSRLANSENSLLSSAKLAEIVELDELDFIRRFAAFSLLRRMYDIILSCYYRPSNYRACTKTLLDDVKNGVYGGKVMHNCENTIKKLIQSTSKRERLTPTVLEAIKENIINQINTPAKAYAMLRPVIQELKLNPGLTNFAEYFERQYKLYYKANRSSIPDTPTTAPRPGPTSSSVHTPRSTTEYNRSQPDDTYMSWSSAAADEYTQPSEEQDWSQPPSSHDKDRHRAPSVSDWSYAEPTLDTARTSSVRGPTSEHFRSSASVYMHDAASTTSRSRANPVTPTRSEFMDNMSDVSGPALSHAQHGRDDTPTLNSFLMVAEQHQLSHLLGKLPPHLRRAYMSYLCNSLP